MPYDLHRLRLLRELSHRGTLAAVATALGYNPSTVSHQLTALEREVGVPLLQTHGRGVRLTPAAEALVGHAEAILAEMERAEASISAMRTEVTGTVAIAAFQTAAHVLIPEILDLLAERHPSLAVRFAHVSAEAAIPALIARDFDIVLSESYPGTVSPTHRGVTTRPVMRDALVLAVPETWRGERLADLATAVWAAEHPGSSHRTWFAAACSAVGFMPTIRFESADLLLHRRLVIRHHAAAVLPAIVADPHPGIRLHPLRDHRTVSCSTRVGSEAHPVIRAVVDAITHTSRRLDRPV